MTSLRSRVGLCLFALATLSASAGCGDSDPGSRGWECIAPAAAGGGWDLTCRVTSQAVNELGLSPGIMRVTNLPGAGGGIAYAHTVGQRVGDEGVLVASSPATTLRLAQGQFAHLTEEDVRWVGAIAADYGIVAVAPNAPWNSLEDLLVDLRRDPSGFVISGGSAVAGQDHMKMLLLAEAAGIDPLAIRYVGFDGSGEALTALLGGFVEVMSGDASGVLPHLEAGNLKVLTVMGPERAGGLLASVPTTYEAGYEVDWVTWRGFYVPRGISEVAYSRWVDVLTQVERSETWSRVRDRGGLEPFLLTGSEFEAFVRQQVAEFREVSRDIGLIQ